jgi:hypothetical protein
LVIQLLPDGRHLAALEVGDLDRPPALGGARIMAPNMSLRTGFSPKVLGMGEFQREVQHS